MDELVAETLRPLNALEPRIESLWLTNSRGESTVRREVSESYIKKDIVNNGHDRTRCQQYNLLPYCPAFMLADGVDLIQYNPSVSYGQHRGRVRAIEALPPDTRSPRSRQRRGKKHNCKHLRYCNKDLTFLRIVHTIVPRVYGPTCTCG
jgi:hypothetical protein